MVRPRTTIDQLATLSLYAIELQEFIRLQEVEYARHDKQINNLYVARAMMSEEDKFWLEMELKKVQQTIRQLAGLNDQVK